MRTNSFGRNSGRGLGQWTNLAGDGWLSVFSDVSVQRLKVSSDGDVRYGGVDKSAYAGTTVTRSTTEPVVDWSEKYTSLSGGGVRGVDTSGSSTWLVSDGTYSSANAGQVLKADSSGGDVFTARITHSSTMTGPYAVAVDSSGNSYSVGAMLGSVTAHGNSATIYSSFLLKLDSSGSTVWAKRIFVADGSTTPSSRTPKTTFLNSVWTDGSHVYLAGHKADLWIVMKFDVDGVLVWSTGITLSGAASTNRWSGVGVVSGNVYAFVQPASGGNGDVAKLDSAGALSWVRHITSGSLISMQADSDGLWTTAYTSTADGIVAQMDLSGGFTWSNKFEFTSGAASGLSMSRAGGRLHSNFSGWPVRVPDDGSNRTIVPEPIPGSANTFTYTDYTGGFAGSLVTSSGGLAALYYDFTDETYVDDATAAGLSITSVTPTHTTLTTSASTTYF